VACLALPYFSTLSHEGHDSEKKLLNIKCVFSFSIQHFFMTEFQNKFKYQISWKSIERKLRCCSMWMERRWMDEQT
jgi:hypothetical protein